MVGLPASLLNVADDLALGRRAGAVDRTALAHGPWVDVRRGWLAGADLLYDVFRRDVPWQAECRQMHDAVVDMPRLTRFYAEGQTCPHPVLEGAA